MVFATAQSQGQVDVFSKGSSAINLGVGFGSTIYHGAGYSVGFPTISLSYEIGIVDVAMGSSLKGVVSVGGFAGYGGSRYNYSYYGGGDIRTNYFLLAVRGNYHFIFHDKFDPYAGVMLGYYFGNTNYPSDYLNTYPTASNGGVRGGVYAGARWFFTPAFAAFAEIGYSMSIITIGATFKF